MTSTVVPFFWPIKARPIGEFTDIFPWSTSDSGSPTICQIFFSLVSASIKCHCCPEFDLIPRKLRNIDDFRTDELIFQL